MTALSRLWERLRNKRYRRAFAATQARRGIAFQIRAMRKKCGWSQDELAQRSGLEQCSISRAENLNYGKLNIGTLLAIANGFDAALLVRIVPFSEVARAFADLSEEAVQVESFDEEDAKADPIAPRESIPQQPLHEQLSVAPATAGARASRPHRPWMIGLAPPSRGPTGRIPNEPLSLTTIH